MRSEGRVEGGYIYFRGDKPEILEPNTLSCVSAIHFVILFYFVLLVFYVKERFCRPYMRARVCVCKRFWIM